ncbi:MAG: acyl carrier protein [Deltaproteobacteria bacterium]|nr:acyl carrier protein [Deltaproteobacteria bacterium]
MSVTEKISAFLRAKFPPGRNGDSIDPNQSLLSAGLIDSLGILKLIAFIEEEFAIELQPDEINLENFDSLAAIARTVESHLVQESGR